MIASWWSKLKHQWLFLHRLETAAAVRRHVAFYVAEYNATTLAQRRYLKICESF
ncbi:MAG: hypothetical protein ABR538_00490 [Candidatus Binatia bacterium]